MAKLNWANFRILNFRIFAFSNFCIFEFSHFGILEFWHFGILAFSPRDHHNRHLRALELRMHQTSPQKNEIEAVLWTIAFSSLHSPARLQLASLAGPTSARFTRGLARSRPRNHHKWTLHALELRMHQTSPQKNEIEVVLWRNGFL